MIINGRADKTACEAVAKEAQTRGVKARVIMADVGLVSEARRAAKEALEAFGTVDVLVANAAIRPDKPFLENTEDDWRRVMGTNLESAIFLSQHSEPVPGSCVLVTLEGTRPMLVEIQALVDSGGPSPRRLSVGLDRDRLAMLLAVLHRHAGVACMAATSCSPDSSVDNVIPGWIDLAT